MTDRQQVAAFGKLIQDHVMEHSKPQTTESGVHV